MHPSQNIFKELMFMVKSEEAGILFPLKVSLEFLFQISLLETAQSTHFTDTTIQKSPCP